MTPRQWLWFLGGFLLGYALVSALYQVWLTVAVALLLAAFCFWYHNRLGNQ